MKKFETRGGGRNLSSHKGFTLAEVLVTLGIIGVVSAMTVPTLMQNYQRKSYVTQLHKVYNEFQQAAIMYMNDKNALNLTEAGLTSHDNVNTFMNNYFKIVKSCDSFDDCFAAADSYKNLNGSNTTGFDATITSFVLASGASIRPRYVKNGESIMNIIVDVNGKSGPNIQGRDMFLMCLYNNGVIDDMGTSAPISKDVRESNFTNICNGASNGIGGCFGKILNDNWEMNY